MPSVRIWSEAAGLLGRGATEHFRMRVGTVADVRVSMFACGSGCHVYFSAL